MGQWLRDARTYDPRYHALLRGWQTINGQQKQQKSISRPCYYLDRFFFRGSNVYSAAGCHCEIFSKIRRASSSRKAFFSLSNTHTHKRHQAGRLCAHFWAQFLFFQSGRAGRIYPACRARVIVHVPLSRALAVDLKRSPFRRFRSVTRGSLSKGALSICCQPAAVSLCRALAPLDTLARRPLVTHPCASVERCSGTHELLFPEPSDRFTAPFFSFTLLIGLPMPRLISCHSNTLLRKEKI